MYHVYQVSPVVCTSIQSPQFTDISNRLSCGSQHIENLMESMEGLNLNCYNYLFANSCLISLDDSFS
jgi:hypothetical protein